MSVTAPKKVGHARGRTHQTHPLPRPCTVFLLWKALKMLILP